MKKYVRVQAEIDFDALKSNVKEIRKLLKEDTKLMVIIKADGYGHGAIPIAHALNDYVDGFGVATVQEAVNLRDAGINKMILILSYTFPEYYEDVVKYDISQTIFSPESAKALSFEAKKQKKTAGVHIALDTGMGRIGFDDTEESADIIKEISKLEGIKTEGIFTHFACADEKDKTSVNRQISRYNSFIELLREKGINIPIRHSANSAAIIDHPETAFDMVRSGIITYGLYPSTEVDKGRLPLKPALRLKSHVIFVKTVPAGSGISYGSTFVTEKETRVATIPVGYADGFPRGLSNKGYVLIHGKKAPILGRVCMDQTMVDVSEIHDVKAGDRVIIIGNDGDEKITVEDLAEMTDTINYEFVCNLTKRVPRTYFESGRLVASMDYTKDEYKAVDYFKDIDYEREQVIC